MNLIEKQGLHQIPAPLGPRPRHPSSARGTPKTKDRATPELREKLRVVIRRNNRSITAREYYTKYRDQDSEKHYNLGGGGLMPFLCQRVSEGEGENAGQVSSSNMSKGDRENL